MIAIIPAINVVLSVPSPNDAPTVVEDISVNFDGSDPLLIKSTKLVLVIFIMLFVSNISFLLF